MPFDSLCQKAFFYAVKLNEEWDCVSLFSIRKE